jgi:PAS domain-containing protein
VTVTEDPGQPKLSGSAAEIAALRRASDTSSSPAWQIDASGNIMWCNAAYRTLYQMAHGHAPKPDKPLFDRHDASAQTEKPTRISLRAQGSETRDWYELSTVKVDGVTCCRAICINAVVDAEDAQRKFVQTLTKTFAQLSIGLAIFDRKRQLALFNPALVDLTRLRAEFLSGRPTLMSFFDGLRENRRMPEPKNYGDWRQRIADLIAAAADGRFEETWSLETGETFRVKGRPHPDGATAFLIEDISAEVTLTRNFRAELELGQSLLDQIDDAIAVFSASGVLSFCNAAYRDLWSVNPDASFVDVTITDSVDVWKRQAAPNPMWPDVEEFVRDFANRDEWDMPVYLKSGLALTCHIAPVVAGATLVRFTDAQSHRALTTRHRAPASDQT